MADQADLARELLGLARDDLAAADALIDVASVTDASWRNSLKYGGVFGINRHPSRPSKPSR